MVSIVLTTYNGEKYILELMDSLRNQTMQPDEVIILDDCSMDSTFKIVSEYIKKYSLNTWKLTMNPQNIGWRMNFLNGIKRAKGKYIFPCDQDDIWDDNKIELMVKTMEKTNALLLCSDYRVIYENNSVRFPRTKISYMKNNGETEKINKMRALMLVDRPGCVYCINSKLKETMSNIWLVDESHDALAWRSAALNDGLYILHIPLISFRRHRGNASDVRNSELTERIRWARHYGKISELMLQYLSSNGGKNKKMKYLNKCIKLQNKRVKYLSNKSLIHIIGLIRYYRYYPTIITYCSDILCIIKGGLL